jgi:alkylation response protein AidB-like acyl-CoA dehydrogenase
VAFGEVVTGAPGFLICSGFSVHQSGSSILSGDGTVVPASDVVDVPDLVINHLGLAIGQIGVAEPDRFRTSLAILAVRLGILGRILDMAYTHLKDRVSFGQKILSHQLVKTTFAEVYGAMVRISEQMRLRAEGLLSEGLRDDHCMVTEITGKAEKLMGGHGYLLGGTHSLSYLSMLLFSIYGATPW